MINNLTSAVKLNLKNVYGWKTKRKIVVFSVDDYGNIRISNAAARAALDKEGMKARSRFDAYDALENKEDLEQLYEALTSVRDINNRNAVFTAFAVPANIDFEKVRDSNYQGYFYELLPETFAKLPDHEGAWNLWQDGIKNRFFIPQFHGREHLNLKVFEERLAHRDNELITALNNRSYITLSNTGYKTINTTAAFSFWDFKDNENLKSIIADGLGCFRKVFGFSATHFNPPGGREHPVLHRTLAENGIRYIDVMRHHRVHVGNGNYNTIFNYTGKKNDLGQIFMVRNCVFEPTDNRGFSWIPYTIKQIEASFRWKKPAVISSHRVNFSGHISPDNRKVGINALKGLLKQIVIKWPDVEFLSSVEVLDLMNDSRKPSM